MKIVCIGEVLVDFTSDNGAGIYVRNFGGAPANVAVMAAKLGARTRFVGMIGKDQFGRYLIDFLEKEQVDTSYVKITKKACTTLAFVQLNEYGERDFDFIRKPGADMLLTDEDIPNDICEQGDILHFGSAQLMCDNAKKAIKKAIRIAKQKGALVSFDPNYRVMQWQSEEKAKQCIQEFCKCVDILKVSDEEAIWLTGEMDVRKAMEKLVCDYQVFTVVTLGKKGAYFSSGKYDGFVSTISRKAIDTTGAGDAFWGTFLAGMLKKGTNRECWKEKEVRETISIANRAGALCVRQKGAILQEKIDLDAIKESLSVV